MNSSTVSTYDNVKTPESLSTFCIYSAINNLLNINANVDVQLFCPLCINSFSLKFSLFEHLRRFHWNFLTQVTCQSLKFKECPFCSAKFYGKHLTAKHALHNHYSAVKKLFLYRNKLKCAFCSTKLSKENINTNVKHIEDLHFLDFVEQLKKMLLNDTVQDVHPTTGHYESQVSDNQNLFINAGIHLKTEINSKIEDFEEASKINCYDFTDLKQQLDKLRDVQSLVKPNSNSVSKSILKDTKNSNKANKSVRRVLRFDLPLENDKENSIFNESLSDCKQISADEYNLCSDNISDKFFKSNLTVFEEPQHCSTPYSKFAKINKNQDKKVFSHYHNSKLKPDKLIKIPRSKMKVQEKKTSEFEFQCGKCRLLFQENLDLVFHVKNNHKKFTLNALQPYYHCAICDAKFYKNRYLKKHHNLHRPY